MYSFIYSLLIFLWNILSVIIHKQPCVRRSFFGGGWFAESTLELTLQPVVKIMKTNNKTLHSFI